MNSNKFLRGMCVSHIKDVDGCICAALIKCATKSSFLLTNYGNLNECLKSIRNDFDIVYICDLGINVVNLDEVKRIREFAEVTYIDHHYNESLLKSLEQMKVKLIHDTRDCAAVLTYNLFRKHLPGEAGLLASYAAISDRLENGPIAKKIIQKYDRDFVLFEAMLLSYAIEDADVSLKRHIVENLSRLEYPHQI
ncbi:MAG: DHHA1 domain-containing protein, partial [Candidatus Ranarchaeia archaeon]